MHNAIQTRRSKKRLGNILETGGNEQSVSDSFSSRGSGDVPLFAVTETSDDSVISLVSSWMQNTVVLDFNAV